MILGPWVFKAKHDIWYFTETMPYVGVEYRTFVFRWGAMHAQSGRGTIGTSTVERVHGSFKQFSLSAVIR